MGRPLVVIVIAATAVGAGAGCGSEDQVPDDDIIAALKLEPSSDRPGYAIGGDPFCEVSDNLLNDADEVEAASEGGKLDLVITDSDQTVGVKALPPFDPECGQKAKRALNKL